MNDDEDRIHSIPTVKDELMASYEEVRRSLGMMQSIAKEVAELKKEMYDEYIKAGFNEKQALELCQKLTL